MKQLLLLCFFWVLLSSFVFSQDGNFVDLSCGKKYKVGAYTVMFPIGKDYNSIYYLVSDQPKFKTKKGFKIVKFDFHNNVILNKKIELTGNQLKSHLEFYNVINDTINIIYSFNNRDHKKKYFFRQTIDGKTLNLNNNEAMIFETDWEDDVFNSSDINYSKMVFSPDSSKILLWHSQIENKNDKILNNGFIVMDNRYHPIWTSKISHLSEEEINFISDMKVTNKGDVCLSVKTYKSIKDFKDTKQSFRLVNDAFTKKVRLHSQLYNTNIVILRKDESPMIYNLSIDNKHIKDLTIQSINDQALLCTGFYTMPDCFEVEGAFSCVITPESSNKIDINNIQPFDLDFLTKGMTDEELNIYNDNKKNNIINDCYDYRFKDLIRLPNGEYYILAERFFTYSEYGNGNTGPTDLYGHFNYHDIFVFFIDTAGVMKQIIKIPKRQYLRRGFNGEPYISFVGYQYTMINDKLVFIYNTMPRHEFKKFLPKLNLIRATMDTNGQITYDSIQSYSKVNSNILIEKGIWINNKTLSLNGFMNSAFKIYPITLSIKN